MSSATAAPFRPQLRRTVPAASGRNRAGEKPSKPGRESRPGARPTGLVEEIICCWPWTQDGRCWNARRSIIPRSWTRSATRERSAPVRVATGTPDEPTVVTATPGYARFGQPLANAPDAYPTGTTVTARVAFVGRSRRAAASRRIWRRTGSWDAHGMPCGVSSVATVRSAVHHRPNHCANLHTQPHARTLKTQPYAHSRTSRWNRGRRSDIPRQFNAAYVRAVLRGDNAPRAANGRTRPAIDTTVVAACRQARA